MSPARTNPNHNSRDRADFFAIAWTWSATLLTSSTFAYSYGVCGPMWYGAMGTFQILLFALIAIKIKANAPGAYVHPTMNLTISSR